VIQGSVLAPILFAFYVDDVLAKLKKSKLGCHVKFVCLTSYLPRLFKKDMLTDPEVFLKIISQNQHN